MAFFKQAKAKIVQPQVSSEYWKRTRTASKVKASKNIVSQASDVLGKPFNPNDYLISHATIVCSVDVTKAPNVIVGSHVESGFPIKRMYTDYRITPETQKYINDNNDAWSRGVIRKSHITYIGADNFVEHVQKAEESKGKVLDVVIRDVGESLYVDILIATDRKHTQLIKDILSHKISTLSMGCVADFTICTKCGNVAYDETQLCPCIRYHKGTTFVDENGAPQIVAELCGHETVDPHGGNKFIEASWVENPAFKGAVLRNVLSPENVPSSVLNKADQILNQVPLSWVDQNTKVASMPKSNSVSVVADDWGGFDFGNEDGGGGEGPPPEGEEKPEEKPKSELDQIDEELSQYFVNKMTTKLKKQIEDALEKETKSKKDPMNSNDSLVKEAQKRALVAYTKASEGLDRVAFLKGLQSLFSGFGKSLSKEVCSTLVKTGSLNNKDPKENIKVVAKNFMKVSGRHPTKDELVFVLKLASWLQNREVQLSNRRVK